MKKFMGVKFNILTLCMLLNLLVFGWLLVVGVCPVQVHASDISTQSIARNVNVQVFYEEINGNKGGVYTQALDGGYAYFNNEETQKTQNQFSFNTNNGEEFYVKAKNGFNAKIYTEINQENNTFSNQLTSVSQEDGLITADISEDTSTTYYVVFERQRFTITLESEATFKLTGAGTYLFGAQANINCEESSNEYQFSKWVKVLGETEQVFQTSKNYSFIVEENLILNAKCKMLLNITQNENGSIVVKQDGQTVTQNYFEKGTEFEISCTANTGYQFVKYTGKFESEAQTFTHTMQSPITLNAVFESKKVSVTITSNDLENCTTETSTDTQNVNFVIGDKINVKFTLNKLFALNNVSTNASGDFDSSLLEQEYTITPQDAENGSITFTANVRKYLSEIKLDFSGYGTIKIGENTFSSFQVLNLSTTQTYNLQLSPNDMFSFDSLMFVNKTTNEQKQININNLLGNYIFSEDGTLKIKFNYKLWYDEKTELTGNGTSANPYLIYTPGDLAYMAYAINYGLTPQQDDCVNYSEATFKIMNDLDLDGRFWILIGSNSDAQFTGVLDMNYRTIKNIVTTDSVYTYNSFPYLFTQSNINHLTLKHDLGALWVTIGIISSVFFAIALGLVILVVLTKQKDIKKVVVLHEEIVDKNS